MVLNSATLPLPRNAIGWVKPTLFCAALLPLLWFIVAAVGDDLGANPIEAIVRGLGDWALRLLLLTLAVTPLRRLSGWGWIAQLRRMLGLYTFFYATLHLLAYVVLDQFFDWTALGHDILKRPFITVGMVSFLILLALAVTSAKRLIKRLGGVRWKRLHSLIYPAAIAAVLHYAMMVKADLREPLIYAGLLALLLGYRLWYRLLYKALESR